MIKTFPSFSVAMEEEEEAKELKKRSHIREPSGVYSNPSSGNEGQMRARGTRERNNLTAQPLLAFFTRPNLKCVLFALTYQTSRYAHSSRFLSFYWSPWGTPVSYWMLCHEAARWLVTFVGIWISQSSLARRWDEKIKKVLSFPRHLFPRWHCSC